MSSPVNTAAGSLSLGVVILAAGASQRMGRPKLLLPWGGTSVLGHLLSQWQQLGAAQIAVVCAQGNTALDTELDRLQFPVSGRIVNPHPEQGMFSSIRCAAGWSGWRSELNLTHWAIVLGDQPHLQPATLRKLLELVAAHPENICQPSRNGRGRHPVVLPKRVFQQLPDAPESNLKQFLGRWASLVARCEQDDPGLDLDLDMPADYERARRL